MGRGRKRKSKGKPKVEISQFQTRNQIAQEINNNATKATVTKPKLENLLQIRQSFDGKKELNNKFYVKQFESLADQTKLTDILKLIIFKAKFSGSACDQLQSQ